MSIKICINGVRDISSKRFSNMIELKQLCDKLAVEYPPELKSYFYGTDTLEMISKDDSIEEATEVFLDYVFTIEWLNYDDIKYNGDTVVDLEKLPKDIKQLRIYISR